MVEVIRIENILNKKIEVLNNLRNHSKNALKKAGIFYIKDIITKNKEDLAGISGISDHTVRRIKKELKYYKLSLNMDLNGILKYLNEIKEKHILDKDVEVLSLTAPASIEVEHHEIRYVKDLIKMEELSFSHPTIEEIKNKLRKYNLFLGMQEEDIIKSI